MSEKLQVLQTLVQQARGIFQIPRLIIAGGAPRDAISGVPIKDVDMFVAIKEEWWGVPDSPFVLGCKRLAIQLGGTAEMQGTNPDYPEMFDLCNIDCGNGDIVQVIGITDDPVDDVQRYDFGLSQVFVTPTGVFFTEAAVKDRANKTITYTPSARDDMRALARSAARYERLRAKYPDWSFVDCEPLATMLDETRAVVAAVNEALPA
jgi:hypothetical protein